MSEKKYIDADLMKEKLKERMIQNFDTAEEFANIGIISAISLVNNIIGADVQDVKHGEWIDIPFGCYPSEHGSYDGRTKCSVCGFVMSRLYYKYCPCCGARMDGETNEI